ncbi:MAG: type IV secretory system conjugative DNA transfer family protein [Desulfatiglandales bacterium]
MELAKRTFKRDDSTYASVSAIRLKGIQVLPPEGREHYESFVERVLNRHIDTVRSLQEFGRNGSFELRYLFRPSESHIVTVYFLVQAIEEKKVDAAKTNQELASFLLNLLRVNNYLQEFEGVENEDDLLRLIEPFQFKHIGEIVRRENMIPLDAGYGTGGRRTGFGDNGSLETSRGLSSKDSIIYYVFPFSLSRDSFERVCSVLMLQKHPCLISICLHPYTISEQDRMELERRLHCCEKYSQLTLGPTVDDEYIGRLRPFLRMQAQAMQQNCTRDLAEFEDSAFLAKIQLASSHPIQHELVSVMGAAITSATGCPDPDAAGNIKSLFSGGYDYYVAKGKRKLDIALNNLRNMDFVPWISTVAKSELKHWRYLFNVGQMAAAFRLPVPIEGEFPGIDTFQYRVKPAPSDLSEKGLLVGENVYLHQRRKVFFKEGDRSKHTYVVGQTGTGKSTLFLNMILQDIQNGEGIGLIDPHGELIEEILPCIPDERKKDVIIIDPRDYQFPVGINMMEAKTPYEKDFCVNYLIEVFGTLYDLDQTGGPIFEMYMRNALQLLLDQPATFKPTVLDVPMLFQDRAFRSSLLKQSTNTYVHNFWKKEAEVAGGDARLENVAPYITSKLSRFIYNDIVRAILGQRVSTIDFRKAMDEGKIVLMDLRKGILGDTNSHFVGMILVGKILTAALGRTEVSDKSTLKKFYLYVDEFQNLATPTFVSILSEARKYGLALTLTNQYISQLEKYIIQGILGNVGTLISFRVGSSDAEILTKEFAEIISKNDLMGLSNWHAYIRLLIDGSISAPFNIRTILPTKSERHEIVEEIRQHSREHYTRSREEVEADIQKGWDFKEN